MSEEEDITARVNEIVSALNRCKDKYHLTQFDATVGAIIIAEELGKLRLTLPARAE